MTLKSYAKFEKKLTCGLENDMENLANFYQSTRKSQNRDFDGILLSKVENVSAVLQTCYVMTMKNHANFEEELTCRFKTGMSNLTNFDPSTQKSQNLNFIGLLLNKVYNVSAKKVQRSYV